MIHENLRQGYIQDSERYRAFEYVNNDVVQVQFTCSYGVCCYGMIGFKTILSPHFDNLRPFPFTD